MMDLSELGRRVAKYLVEGLLIALLAHATTKKPMQVETLSSLALIIAASLAMLDTYLPAMGISARTGAGFGLGAALVGFPR